MRLFAPASSATIRRFEGSPAFIDPRVLLSAVRGDWAIYAARPDYEHGVQVWQDLGTSTRQLPADIADGLKGLDAFFRVKLWNADGDLVLSKQRDFCPDGEDIRVSAAGPMESSFPRSCYTGPFTLGTVWGIEQGWALRPFEWSPIRFNGPNGRYTMRVSISPRYRALFGIADSAASATVALRIREGGGGCPDCPLPGTAPRPGSVDHSVGRPQGPIGMAPTLIHPPADTIPDLRALPAWSITLSQRGQRELIEFAATVWNAGPAPMLVEGFRRGDEPIMDAYQYFMRDGEALGRRRVGSLEYHAENHNHWHFLQFAKYSLWDASMDQIVVSQKQAFCLAPTDAIDLTVPGADWRPGDDGLGTACGSYDPDAQWTRETLQAGWGDTYYQVTGTSLNVTGLANGVYYVAVKANPKGLLYETDASNNLELRKIASAGRPAIGRCTCSTSTGIDA